MGDLEDVHADSRDCYQETLLSLGAERGHIAVTVMLLERYDIDATFVEVTSCTFLSHPAAVWCVDTIL